MTFSEWVELNREKLGSKYEILFATRVLPLVQGLQSDNVTAQHPFVDTDGKNRYCDFTIAESEVVRVAIEIDGYDKRGNGTGMSHEDFLDWQRRQASLASQGWHVLRFANRDVRDHPGRCADYISRLLNRLRQAQTGRVEIVTIQAEPLAGTLSFEKVEEIEYPEVPKKRIYRWMFWIALGFSVSFFFWKKDTRQSVVRVPPPTEHLTSVISNSHPFGYGTEEMLSPPELPAKVLAAEDYVPPAEINSGVASDEMSYGALDCSNPLDWTAAAQHIGEIVTVIGPLLASKDALINSAAQR